MDMKIQNFLVRANPLVDLGFRVFPLQENAKIPAIKKFPTQATTDAKRIWSWNLNGPDRNVGVSTTVSEMGPLIVIDVDNKDGRDGDGTMQALADAGFPLAQTFTVRTPTGGYHYYFHAPYAVKQGANVLGEGVDIRSMGGYVVGPGSVINGVEYKIIDESRVAPAPQWLLDRVQRAPDKPERTAKAKSPKAVKKSAGERSQTRAIEWLQNGAEPGVKGSRNETGFRVAARLKDWVNDPDEVVRLMAEYWECEPPAPIEDLEKIVANAFKYGSDEPGCADPRNVFEPVAANDDDEAPTGVRGASEDAAWAEATESAKAWDAAQAEQKAEAARLRRANFFFDGDTPPAPARQIIKRLLNSTGVAIVGGQSGAGKTFVVIDMAVALASGQGFFGHKVKERVGVAIVAYEGAGSIHLRINAAREARGIDGTLPIIWTRGDADLRTKEALANLSEDIKTLGKETLERFGVRLGCIVIDTLGRAFSMKDENDNAEANAIIGALDRLSNETGAVVVAVHHYGKTEAVGLRGASAWRGGADTVLSVLADRNETTGAVSNRRIALAKSRDNEEGPISGFDLVEVRIGVDEDLETITTCHVSPREARRDQSEIDVPLDKARVCLDALRGRNHRYDKQAAAWAGHVVARVLGIDLGVDGAKRRVEKIIDRWISKGVLESFTAPDASRKDKIYVRVIGDFEE